MVSPLISGVADGHSCQRILICAPDWEDCGPNWSSVGLSCVMQVEVGVRFMMSRAAPQWKILHLGKRSPPLPYGCDFSKSVDAHQSLKLLYWSTVCVSKTLIWSRSS
jgi:hypothetical protein